MLIFGWITLLKTKSITPTTLIFFCTSRQPFRCTKTAKSFTHIYIFKHHMQRSAMRSGRQKFIFNFDTSWKTATEKKDIIWRSRKQKLHSQRSAAAVRQSRSLFNETSGRHEKRFLQQYGTALLKTQQRQMGMNLAAWFLIRRTSFSFLWGLTDTSLLVLWTKTQAPCHWKQKYCCIDGKWQRVSVQCDLTCHVL